MSGFVRPRHQSFEDIISSATEIIRDRVRLEIPPLQLVQYAGEACIEFATTAQCGHGSVSQVLITGQRLYRVPPDFIAMKRVAVLYPTEARRRILPALHETEVLEAQGMEQSGYPTVWYPTEDREHFGIWRTPEKGGEESVTTGAGNAGGTTVVIAGLSSTDDFYNGLELTIMEGTLEGQSQTISDYVASTGTFTVDTAFSAQVPSGVEVEVGSGTLLVDYTKAGNTYSVLPVAAVVQASPAPTRNVFAMNLTDRAAGYYDGCEVFFNTGTIRESRSRVVSSVSTATSVTVTVFPKLPAKPVAADACTVRDVPNIPDLFHHYLVDYVVYRATMNHNPRLAASAYERFVLGTREALNLSQPEQAAHLSRMKAYDYLDGEDQW